MNINHDYMAVMRTGARITRSQFKKEQEAGVIVSACFLGAIVIIVLAIIF